MVDLVKIRKKKGAGRGARGAEDAPKAAPAPQEEAATQPAPVAESAPPAGAVAAAGSRQPATSPSKLDRFKESAGKRRDAAVAQTVEGEQRDLHELLTFTIADEHYAVDIERIVEIVTPRSVTRIPNADPSVVGIISLRGTIVTLVDVRRKLRHPPAGDPTPDTRIVVIDFQREIVGFIVDRVLRVVKADTGAVEPHPVVHAAELDDSILGVFRAGGALTILLDLDKLLDHRALATKSA